MYLKRQKVPKKWGIPRKGSTYVVRPNSDLHKSVPLLIVLRDILKLAQNRKEVKRAIHLKQILINHKNVSDEKNSIGLFDILTIIPAKKNYQISLNEKGKLNVQEIPENQGFKKVAKIINKRVLKGKKIQLNLSDGSNFLSDIKCNPNDSVLINLKEKKIEKCLELKEKAKVMVFEGKHAGEKGIINKLESEKKMMSIILEDKSEIHILIKQLMVVE